MPEVGKFINFSFSFFTSHSNISHIGLIKLKEEVNKGEKKLAEQKVKILDATLREGEQQAGVRFTAEEKIEILHLLEEFNVDYVEVGHPGISPEDEQICHEVALAAKKAEILMHARADLEEVRAVKRAEAQWVGIWASTNHFAMETKFGGHDEDYIFNKINESIQEAKRLGLKVRFTIEDASRTPTHQIIRTARVALDAGADRISLADTTGTLEPESCRKLVQGMVQELNCEIEIHLHNDLGLALANSLAAIEAGASVIDTTILGIGERAGITDLIQLTVALFRLRKDERFPLEKIPQLAQAIQWTTGFHPDDLRPIIGKNAFTHTCAYHVKSVKKNPESYEAFSPQRVGRTRTIESRLPLPQENRIPFKGEVGKPFAKGSSELLYHRDGPGTRWVLMDSRIDTRASFYIIQRFIGLHGIPFIVEKHVDVHAHHCDSTFIFWGDQPDGTGLVCQVQLGEEDFRVESPASVFIPAGIEHSYFYISGKGTYTNVVLAPNYNRSLMPQPIVTAIQP